MSEGWNAIMVRDIIYSMAEFAARKCEGWDDNEDWDYTTENPEITDAEMEQIVPGIIQQVTKTVARHIPSDEMYLAIYAEARELAQTAVNEMDPKDQAALINAARKKVHKARARKENGQTIKRHTYEDAEGRPPLWESPPPTGSPKRRRSRKMPLAMKMSEAKKIQEAVGKVREMMCSSDKNPFQEYWWNDHRYSPIAQPFHREILGALSAENVHPYGLPDAWGRMMNANRAHLVIMLREAGAAHYPFSDAEWPSTPAQVWENLAQMEQLPDLEGANLSRIDFKWADLANANLTGADLSGTDLRWADLTATDLTGANLCNADLSWASLMEADLQDADLRGAILNRTNLTGADLTRTNMAGVNLHSAYLDDNTKLDGAIGLD